MSATITPRIATGAFPTVVNDLKYALFDPIDGTEIAQQTFAAPHPERTVSFMGLDRQNYDFKLMEMVAGLPVNVRQTYSFVPDRDDILYREPEMLQVDHTPGFASNVNTVMMDGTGGRPDWRGWTPIIEKRGFGTIASDEDVLLNPVDYTFDMVTGEWTLLQDGDIFEANQYYHVEFELIIAGTAAVPLGRQFSEVLTINNDTVLLAADMGKKWLIQGAVDYVENTLPQLSTVVRNRVTYVEAGIGNHKCCAFKCYPGDKIDFGKGDLNAIRIGVCESFELYKGKDAADNDVWRVSAPVGNFLKVGRHICSDADESIEFNVLPFNGAAVSSTSYARLYEDHVLLLDPAQVIDYAAWPASDKTKYSYADPGTGNFYVPDRRGLVSKNSTAIRLAGTYEADAIKEHYHLMIGPNDGGDATPTNTTYLSLEHSWSSTLSYRLSKSNSVPVVGKTGLNIGGSAENLVRNFAANMFVLV